MPKSKSVTAPVFQTFDDWQAHFKEAALRHATTKLADTDAIEHHVEKVIHSVATELVAKLLGMSNNWGKWELDHCNGRAGQSDLGVALRERMRVLADATVAKAMEGWEPSKVEIAALRKEFNEQFRYRMKEAVSEMANDAVQKCLMSLHFDDESHA